MVKNDALNKQSTIEVIAKVLNLLTDGKADALVRRILGWFSTDEGVRLAMV